MTSKSDKNFKKIQKFKEYCKNVTKFDTLKNFNLELFSDITPLNNQNHTINVNQLNKSGNNSKQNITNLNKTIHKDKIKNQNNIKNNSIEIITNSKKSNTNRNKSVENNIIKNKLNDLTAKNEKKKINTPNLGKRKEISNLDTNEIKKSQQHE